MSAKDITPGLKLLDRLGYMSGGSDQEKADTKDQGGKVSSVSFTFVLCGLGVVDSRFLPLAETKADQG